MRNVAQFRERFKRWKLGELVYENGRPLQQYRGGKDDEEQSQDDAIYSEFHKTLPKNLQSGNYRMRRYWELNGKPKDFYQGAIKGMFSPESNGWHAKSVAYDAENNVYELMKPNSHPTRWMEDREYQNTPDFKKDWVVEKSIFGENGYDRYIPRHRRLDGGMHYTNLPEFKAGKDGDDNANRVKITERRHGDSVLYTTDNGTRLIPISKLDENDMSTWTFQEVDNPALTYSATGAKIKSSTNRDRLNLESQNTTHKRHRLAYRISNEHYNDPIIGSYARATDRWENNSSPIKALLTHPASEAIAGDVLLSNALRGALYLKRAWNGLPKAGSSLSQLDAWSKIHPNAVRYIDMSSPEASDLAMRDRLVTFFDLDVLPRIERSRRRNLLILPKNGRIAAGEGGEFVNSRNIKEFDFGENPYGGYSSGDNTIALNSKDRRSAEEILSHELHHSSRANLGDIYSDTFSIPVSFLANPYAKTFQNQSGIFVRDPGYTFNEARVLDKAYKFSDAYLSLHADVVPLMEKGATNALLRYLLYRQTNKTGKLLDDYIDNMSDQEVLNHVYLNPTSGYMRSFKDSYQEELDAAYKQFKDTLPMSKIIQMVNANRANSIRNAWKEVGLVPRINPDDDIIMASRGYNGEKLSASPYESFVSLLGPSLYRKLHQRKVKNVDTVYDNMIRQLAYESNYGRSNIAKKHHNYGGVGFNGLKYSAFKSDDEFLDRYLDIMTGRHKNALKATTPSGYAKALKLSGYYEDSYENYSKNLSGMKTVSRVALAHKKSNYDLYYPKMSELTAVLVLLNSPTFLPQPITSDVSVPYKPDNEYEEQEQINATLVYKNLFGPLSTNKNNITFNDILLLYENLYGEVPAIK